MSKTKIILGVVVIGLVVAALAMSDSSLFKGSAGGLQRKEPNRTACRPLPDYQSPGSYPKRCSPAQLNYSSATGSTTLYHVSSAPDRCTWSCSAGTKPDNDNATGECKCNSEKGLIENGVDSCGRRVCTCSDGLMPAGNGRCPVPPPPADNTPPTISFVSPQVGFGDFVTAGNIVELRVNVNDDVKVARVEFFDGATLIGSLGPDKLDSSFAWNTAGVFGDAEHYMKAKAYDTSNNTSEATVSIFITPPPTAICPDGSPMTPGVSCPPTQVPPPNAAPPGAGQQNSTPPPPPNAVPPEVGQQNPTPPQVDPNTPVSCTDNDVDNSPTVLGTVVLRRGDVTIMTNVDRCENENVSLQPGPSMGTQRITEYFCEGNNQEGNPVRVESRLVDCLPNYACSAGLCYNAMPSPQQPASPSPPPGQQPPNTPPPPDNTPPFVSFVNPQDNSVVTGIVSLRVAVSDNSGSVARVEFRDGERLVGSSSDVGGVPFVSFDWNTATDEGFLVGRSHTIEAKAYDTSNNFNTATITVSYPNCTDSDGGFADYGVRGTAIGTNDHKSDSCNGNNLLEYGCNIEGDISHETIPCSTQVCLNGACVDR